MGEPTEENQEPSFVFNSMDILDELYNNKVPEELEGRLEYTTDQLSDGTTLEVYEDKETGDQFRFGNLPPTRHGSCYSIVYRIVKTKVAEYKILSYRGGQGYVGSEFFINGREVKDIWIFRASELFFHRLKNQQVY